MKPATTRNAVSPTILQNFGKLVEGVVEVFCAMLVELCAACPAAWRFKRSGHRHLTHWGL